jgi:hypothetical protein
MMVVMMMMMMLLLLMMMMMNYNNFSLLPYLINDVNIPAIPDANNAVTI